MRPKSEKILTRIIREEIMKALAEAAVVQMPMKQQNEHGMCECQQCMDEAVAKLGSGARFKKLTHKLAAKGAHNPKALAAWIGRKKYGAKKMGQLSHHESQEFEDYETPNSAEHPDRAHEHERHLVNHDGDEHHPLDCECNLCREDKADERTPSHELTHDFPEDREGMKHEAAIRKPSHDERYPFPEDRKGKKHESKELTHPFPEDDEGEIHESARPKARIKRAKPAPVGRKKH